MERLDLNASVACSLSDQDFRERRQFARLKLLPMVTKFEHIKNGLVFWISSTGTDENDLKTFIQLEEQCCGFLTFTILRATDDENNEIGLKIEGSPQAAKTLEMFAQAVKSAGLHQKKVVNCSDAI